MVLWDSILKKLYLLNILLDIFYKCVVMFKHFVNVFLENELCYIYFILYNLQYLFLDLASHDSCIWQIFYICVYLPFSGNRVFVQVFSICNLPPSRGESIKLTRVKEKLLVHSLKATNICQSPFMYICQLHKLWEAGFNQIRK